MPNWFDNMFVLMKFNLCLGLSLKESAGLSLCFLLLMNMFGVLDVMYGWLFACLSFTMFYTFESNDQNHEPVMKIPHFLA